MRAIVLSAIKYGDSSAIVKFYTREEGLLSGIKKGAYSRRAKSTFAYFPLATAEIDFRYRPNAGLQSLRKIEYLPLSPVFADHKKSSVLWFLAEVLLGVLGEQDQQAVLFDFLEEGMQQYTQETVPDFHFYFLAQMTRYLGFDPDLTSDYPYFDLLSGTTVPELTGTGLSLAMSQYWKELFRAQWRFSATPKEERRKLLRALLDYFRMHIQGFRTPKSLEILEAVFDS